MAADQVGEHPVVPLPVEWPGAAPVLIGGGELRRTLLGPLGALAQTALPAQVGDQLSDGYQVTVALAPHGVLAQGQVSVGAVERAE